MTAQTQRPPRTDRKGASAYLAEKHGLKVAATTLAKYACIGGGPLYRKVGRRAVYDFAALDEYAEGMLSAEARHATEHASHLEKPNVA